MGRPDNPTSPIFEFAAAEQGFNLRTDCGAAGGGLMFANDRPERKLGL